MNYTDLMTQKVAGSDRMERMLALWRFQGRKIVFTNGCFDLIHPGHIDYLSRAAALGDILVIGLNSDASVRRLKGSHRPIMPEQARAMVLAAIHFVNAVVLFDEDTPYRLIAEVKPDILVKGGDYRKDAVVGADLLAAYGGEVIILPFLEGYSTSSIEEKIRKAGLPEHEKS
ncbi:MAG TPA: D-glycero-beta-D-manno-heptose 1-phosphate adenylyltransferase [Bacteroidales bacterium]|nr:D-glycero-beta-D-manno-heptose 1-phosphate adenylyltransferase [Bacteroidales bacterium]HSA42146.1 D-glycero-beta-D-manno-heptose 1-phosphate adenylyltransferase [Bacteroidales bacterium]